MRLPAGYQTKKPSKYRNQKVGGYDSKREYRRAQELRLLARVGEISDLQEQVKFELIPKQEGERAVHYLADFVYSTRAGQRVVEDTKGHRTPVYNIKRKLMLQVHGIRILET